MKYKVIRFSVSTEPEKVIQQILDTGVENGYRYVNHEYNEKIFKGSDGCFGVIGAKPNTLGGTGFVIFTKDKE